MAIKLIAIDMDGTLLNNQKEITLKTKKVIAEAKERNIKVVLATGRPLPGVISSLKELNLEESGDYVMTYNGSLVQESDTGKAIVSYKLSYEEFIEIEAMSRTVGAHLHTIDETTIYTANRHISPYTMHEVGLTNMPLYYRPVDEMTADMSIVKMMMIDEPTVLDSAIARLPKWFHDKYTTAKSTPFYFEVLNPKANKGNALHELIEHLGIKKSEVMAIGDNENDLPMIDFAGVGVAMANAVQSVKETADVITLSNDQDGVAHAIETYAFM